MPLDAITIAGWCEATRSIDCCTEETVVIRVVQKMQTPRSRSLHVRVELVGALRVEVQRLGGHRAVDDRPAGPESRFSSSSRFSQ